MVGLTILHYKILEKLGQGGMGEVYKARDTKLDRFVALKFLTSQLTASEDDKARFIQEAKATSAMNHPNVCTIHSIEEYNNQVFIVMEFVEGKTLKDKKDSLSEKQILEIGIQAAEGLAAAHEKGIVHRDIKPENIMIRKDGIAQIMDFGLAKLRETSGISRLTKVGTTMGTLAYMSPEQVQGLDVDHRTDIFSLGVVLFELLTGESPFKAEYETALMYEIVNSNPASLSSVKNGIEPELDGIILECLEKDKDERCQSAKELSRNLKRILQGNKDRQLPHTKSISKETGSLKSEADNIFFRLVHHISKNKISSSITIIAIIAVILLALTKLGISNSSGFTQPIHFSFDITPESSQILNWQYVLDISPDGKSIAYVDFSKSVSSINIRYLDKTSVYSIRGTEGAENPVFENNNWISFTVNALARKIQLTGGIPDVSHSFYGDGFIWGSKGEIVSAEQWPDGLTFQSKWNGQDEKLTEIDSTKDEGTHLLPYILPGDKAAVFTIWSKDGSFDDSKIAVVNLVSKKRNNLSYKGIDLLGTSPRFIQPPWGNYLLWSRSGNLYASLFDLSDLKVDGPEIKIMDGISVNSSSGRAAYSVSNANNGTITYIPGNIDTAKTELIWVDNNGIGKKAISRSGPFLMPWVGKSGNVLVVLNGPAYKIGEVNFEKNKVDSLFIEGDSGQPRTTPDGNSYVFVSNFQGEKYGIFERRLDGVGAVKKIFITGGVPGLSNVSPDGSKIMFSSDWKDNPKIWIKNINDDSAPVLLFKSDASFTSPDFSPDGKFIAYRSNELDGRFKLFVRPFPINNIKIQLSINDGLFPQWSASNTEIFYQVHDKIMVAKIQTKPELKILSRRIVYTTNFMLPDYGGSDFAVAPDGRILLLKSLDDQIKPVKVKVIANWFTELKKLLISRN